MTILIQGSDDVMGCQVDRTSGARIYIKNTNNPGGYNHNAVDDINQPVSVYFNTL